MFLTRSKLNLIASSPLLSNQPKTSIKYPVFDQSQLASDSSSNTLNQTELVKEKLIAPGLPSTIEVVWKNRKKF